MQRRAYTRADVDTHAGWQSERIKGAPFSRAISLLIGGGSMRRRKENASSFRSVGSILRLKTNPFSETNNSRLKGEVRATEPRLSFNGGTVSREARAKRKVGTEE